MAVEPDSIASLPLFHLRNTLARSSAFQSFVGTKGGEIGAFTFIHYVSTTTAPPFAVLDVDSGDWSKIAEGAFEQTGTLELVLRSPIADANSGDAAQADQGITFLNSFGNIIRDLLKNAAIPGGFLDIQAISHSTPARPKREDRASIGDFYEVVITITYLGAVG